MPGLNASIMKRAGKIGALIAAGILLATAVADAQPRRRQPPTLKSFQYHRATVILDRSTPDPRIQLFAALPQGLGRRTWTPARGWGQWRIHSRPGTGDVWKRGDTVVALPWYDSSVGVGGLRGGPRINVFFRYFLSGSRLGAPRLWTQRTAHQFYLYNWETVTPFPALNWRSRNFFPGAGFAWYEGGSGKINLFGTSLSVQYLPLDCASEAVVRQAWWNGQSWAWVDRGRPPGTTTVKMHPSGAVWDRRRQLAWVFVVTCTREHNSRDPNNFSPPEVWYYHYDAVRGWRWERLGNPYGTSFYGIRCQDCPDPKPRVISARYLSGPVVIARRESGRTKIDVLVRVQRLRRIGRRLVEEWGESPLWVRSYDGRRWSSWTLIDAPKTFLSLFTTGVARRDPRGTWHVHVFGSEPLQQAGGPPFSQVVEYMRTGGVWRRGFTVAQPRGTGGVNLASSAVYDGPNRDYITVVGRARTGEIWELYWDSNDPVWRWRKLYPP